jgi:hypothetical protein
VSPILVRPVREQLEHDRVIRQLQVRLKRRHDVAINTGEQQIAGIRIGPGQMYPDLVLTSLDRKHRLEGIVEVETGESVNHLEAMAQWAHFGRVRAPFHLYVPAGAVEIARRLCADNQVTVTELWSYHTIGDQTRFTLVHKAPVQTRRATASRRSDGTAKAPRKRTPAQPRRSRVAAKAAGGKKPRSTVGRKTTQKRK